MRIISVAVLLLPCVAAAKGNLRPPDSVETLGAFGGAEFVRYKGLFKGKTSTGKYLVPYEVVAPARPTLGNGTVVVEPPHVCGGTIVRDGILQAAFLYGRGFAHAAVGYALNDCFGTGLGTDYGILDPERADDVYIEGGVRYYQDQQPFAWADNRTDDEIIADFGRALVEDPLAQRLLGRVERRYVTGLSQSSEPIVRMIDKGQAEGVFDLAFPLGISSGSVDIPDPQIGIEQHAFSGKVVSVGAEGDWPIGVQDPVPDEPIYEHYTLGPGSVVARPSTLAQYRRYVVAGASHAPEEMFGQSDPVSWVSAGRSFFVAADHWVTSGAAPPPSTHLEDDCPTEPFGWCRDANGNTISVDAGGNAVARHPLVTLGEATFNEWPFGICSFIGCIGDGSTRSIGSPGFFATDDAYRAAFKVAVDAYQAAGFILPDDAAVMLERSRLCPSLTYTQIYAEHYESFLARTQCP